MRIADITKLVGGSCVVYFVMAACGAAYSEQESRPAGGPSSGGPPSDSMTPTGPTGPVPNALAEGHKSGSRLKLRFWEGADGSRQFIDFFDTQLQTRCTVEAFSRTSDGAVRCLPPVQGTLYFSDSMCKTPIVYAVDKASNPQPKVAAIDVDPLSAMRYREHYTLKGLVNPPATVFARGKGIANQGEGGCGTATTVPAGQNSYEVGAPLAATTFVEMTIKTE